jgi:pantetheine-phosphate adenylyltransferase
MVRMIGLYAGSFDPVHLGHLDIIEAASQQCSQVYVAVLRNPTKGSGLIPLEDRNDVLGRCVRDMHNVLVASYEGLLIRLARELGADTLIRGAVREPMAEMQMALTNSELGDLPTMFIPCRPEHAHISSSLVRALLTDRGAAAVKSLVPEPVFEWLHQTESQSGG